MVVFIEDKKQKESISSIILADLPDWFGLPDSTAEVLVRNYLKLFIHMLKSTIIHLYR